MPALPDFAPLKPTGGYLPLDHYGLIGDGAAAALVGRDGAIAWLCVPRFDSPPLFASILDARRGGSFRLAPDRLTAARQWYETDTGILITEMCGPSGLVRITDALSVRSGADLAEDAPAARGELLRLVAVIEGEVRLTLDVEPRGGADWEPRAGGLRLRCRARPELDLQLTSTRRVAGQRSTFDLGAGDRLHFVLRWGGGAHRHQHEDAEELLQSTRQAWRSWSQRIEYQGPRAELVRRSAVTLKLLDHFENGAIVAAPTSSLPEVLGGSRNWDYRYTWIRDAAFSVYALRRIGLIDEARGFLGWVLDSVQRGGRAGVLYDLDGGSPPKEREDPELEGYLRSAPVRWGNAAADQVQHDAFGEILDCAYQWSTGGGVIEPILWGRLQPLVEEAGRVWHTPDHGIWEVRTVGRTFTYSAAMCQVALDRGARLARHFGFPGNPGGWSAHAARIRETILKEAWDPRRQALTEHLGGGGLDAGLLSLPLRRVLEARHPCMIATSEAIRRHLGAGQGLLYRYLPEESPDGLPGHEGAFLLCSFWLVDNLALQGRLDDALALYDSLCDRAGTLGLLPEQVDPSTGAYLGNYPQAFSHVGVISSGINLARQMANR